MEAQKISENVEFEVIYADGTRKRVREGILFEADGDRMILHNGTDRKEVLFSVPLAYTHALVCAGLVKEFNEYRDETVKSLKKAAKRMRRENCGS